MNSKELRIGNYVTQEGEFIQGISSNSIHKFDLKQILLEPISLTEEWLLKFGFHEKYKSTSNRWSKYTTGRNGLDLHDCEDDGGDLKGIFYYNFTLEVLYVHQLQNLYYAVTGEELNEQY